LPPVTIVSLKASTSAAANTNVRAAAEVVYRVALSDGSLFSLKNKYVPPEYQIDASFSPGKVLSDDGEAALRFAASCYRAERAALRLVARAEQCEFGLSRKLGTRGHEESCVRAALAHLSAQEVVSDDRFAIRWLQSRLNAAGQTPQTLLLGLRRRGIRLETARQALAVVLDLETELVLLRRFLEKQRFGPEPCIRLALKRERFSQAAIAAFFEAEG
jgi:regulatory protein